MFKFMMLFVYLIFIVLLLHLWELKVPLFLDDGVISSLFVIYLSFVYIIRVFLKVKMCSAFSLFYITCVFFIGGRFFSYLLGEKDIFSFDFFFSSILDNIEINNLMYYVFIGFISLEIGLLLSLILFNGKNKFYYRKEVELELKDGYVISFAILYGLYTIYSALQTLNVSMSSGYEYIYMSQTGSYKSGVISSILAVFVGICLSQKNKFAKKIVLSSMFISMLLYLLAGKRAEILSFVFLLIWIYADYGRKKIDKKVILMAVIAFFSIMLFFNYFSFRGETQDLDIGNLFKKLFYELGGTLLIFEHSITSEIDYPIIPYIQSFIPGTSFLFKIFGGDLDAKDTMFSLYLSYRTSPELFFDGFGLGWSFFSDAYIFGCKNIIFYSVFIILFSMLINFLQYYLSYSVYARVILSTILMSLVFLPRSSISSIFPIMWYCILITYVLKKLARAK